MAILVARTNLPVWDFQKLASLVSGIMDETNQNGYVSFFINAKLVGCAEGTSEPFAVEVGLHQGSAFSPFLFAIRMHSLAENKQRSTLADSVRE